ELRAWREAASFGVFGRPTTCGGPAPRPSFFPPRAPGATARGLYGSCHPSFQFVSARSTAIGECPSTIDSHTAKKHAPEAGRWRTSLLGVLRSQSFIGRPGDLRSWNNILTGRSGHRPH